MEMRGPEVRLNREERRIAAKKGKRYGASVAAAARLNDQRPIVNAQAGLELISSDRADIDSYSAELDFQNKALDHLRSEIHLNRVLRGIGLSDETIRWLVISNTDPTINRGNLRALISREADHKKFDESKGLIVALLSKSDTTNRYVPEEVTLWNDMVADPAIPLEDLYFEAIRSTGENAALLQLQIDWLTEQASKNAPEQLVQPLVVTEEDKLQPPAFELGEAIAADHYPLTNWRLYWTTHHWSMDPHHLVNISTVSREVAFEQLQAQLFGEVMVKPLSVLRALEFHLGKNILQRALSARLRYVPEDVRKWAKVKRGRDRIFIRVPEENQAIFFAGNRDTIYRRN